MNTHNRKEANTRRKRQTNLNCSNVKDMHVTGNSHQGFAYTHFIIADFRRKKNQSQRRKEGADTEMRTKYPTD